MPSTEVRRAAAALWLPPLRALYLALALLALVVVLAHAPPPLPVLQAIGAAEEEARAAADARQAAQDLSALEQLEQQWDDLAAPELLELSPPPLAAASADWQEYRIRRGDTLDRILQKTGASDDLRAFVGAQKLKSARKLRARDVFYYQKNAAGELTSLLYKTSSDYYLRAGVDAAGAFWANEAPPQTTLARRHKGGVISSTLYETTAAVGMSNRAADQLIAVLETQIDLYRDVRNGDGFRVVYEETLDEYGAPLDAGRVLAFEYDSRHEGRPRVISGAYFDSDSHAGYYDRAGESMQRAFLPAPLRFRRISSRFSPRRFHPVLKRWRPHRGVDYAARSGTPVRATADGKVSVAGRQKGYGKVIMIKHYNNVYTTVYAHLRAFAKGVRRGAWVAQGQVIGYVGQTGLATGPHLHYEFRVRGKHRDPLSVSVPKQVAPLQGDTLHAFERQSAPLFAELAGIALEKTA